MKKALLLSAGAAILGSVVLANPRTELLSIAPKAAYATAEPLLLFGEQQHYSILPKGTVLYFDRAWPEGHQTFHVYFHIKGEFKAERADPELISPLWLQRVDPEGLPKLMKDYPLTKDELVEILKARQITKAELTAILQDWPDK